jgi:2-(1,2-epoxy-1,2-dihydrophenyl)acetyl-CoA isomerase
MTFETIIFQRANHIATIRLNRPQSFNAMDSALVNDLVRALEFCWEDEDTRVVMITGEGKAFSSGGDLAVLRDYLETNPSEIVRQAIKGFNVLIMTLRTVPKPVIAAINGAVAGGGLSVAAACDLRVAASSAIFKQAYTSIAFVPDGAWTLTVPMLIGLGKASELILLDPVLSAKQALEIGLVNKVVQDAELEQVSYEIAAKIAQGPTKSFAIAKENLNNAMLGLLERQLELERFGMIKAAKTLDYKEGLTAFFEKRRAIFSGK